MCMEDVRMGREATGREIAINVGTAAVPLVPGSADRIALLLGPPLAGTLTYSTTRGITSGLGFNIGAGQTPLLLSIQDVGDLVRMAWYVVGDAAARTGAASETLLKKE